MTGRQLARWLASPLVAVPVRLGLGLIFVAAALPKLADPPAFAHAIWLYDMLPHALVNLKALALPGVEMAVGVMLLAGVWQRAAALLTGGMLVMFIVALAYALLTDNPVDCGCFGVGETQKTDAELFAQIRVAIVRDLGMLVLVGHVLWVRGRRPAAPAAAVTAESAAA